MGKRNENKSWIFSIEVIAAIIGFMGVIVGVMFSPFVNKLAEKTFAPKILLNSGFDRYYFGMPYNIVIDNLPEKIRSNFQNISWDNLPTAPEFIDSLYGENMQCSNVLPLKESVRYIYISLKDADIKALPPSIKSEEYFKSSFLFFYFHQKRLFRITIRFMGLEEKDRKKAQNSVEKIDTKKVLEKCVNFFEIDTDEIKTAKNSNKGFVVLYKSEYSILVGEAATDSSGCHISFIKPCSPRAYGELY
ncbi:hypothetical protein [Larkinella soli]|uniref:hypothetical protein n=1 Tax=Larkinella soli TaxID=1770527 RepID=UPI000FFB4D47|nr:hypothetical protein [Larkinella soli]